MTLRFRWSALLLMAGCLAAAGCSQPGFGSRSKPVAAWPATNNPQPLSLAHAPPQAKSNWFGGDSPFGKNTAGSAPTSRNNSSPPAGTHGRIDSDERGQLDFARLTERRGQLKEAEQMYRAILARNPQQPEAHHRLGVLASQRGAFDEAAGHFDKAQSLMPPNVELLNDMGYLCFLQHRLDDAEKYLQQALERDRNHVSACNNLGLVLGEQGRFREAQAMFKRVGSESQAYANMAYLYTQVGDFEQAQACYSRALTLDNTMRPAANAMMQVAQHQKYLSTAPPTPSGPPANSPPTDGPQTLTVSDSNAYEVRPVQKRVEMAQADIIAPASWVDRNQDAMAEIVALDESLPRPKPKVTTIRLESTSPAEPNRAPALLDAPTAFPIAEQIARFVELQHATKSEPTTAKVKPKPLKLAMLDIRDPQARLAANTAVALDIAGSLPRSADDAGKAPAREEVATAAAVDEVVEAPAVDEVAKSPAKDAPPCLSPVTKAFIVQRDVTPKE